MRLPHLIVFEGPAHSSLTSEYFSPAVGYLRRSCGSKYQFSIHVLEKELSHAREMRALLRAHVDFHDHSFNVVGTRIDRIESGLEKAEAIMLQLSAAQLVTEQKLQTLTDLMLHERPNGKH